MSTDTNSRQLAAQQYADALTALNQPVWPADHAPADPYGRTLSLAAAFPDEAAFALLHPEMGTQQRADLVREQKTTRQWRLDVLLDTRLGDQVTAGIQGIAPGSPGIVS